jgi:hypothetical protein
VLARVGISGFVAPRGRRRQGHVAERGDGGRDPTFA